MAQGHDQQGRTIVRRSITIGRGRDEVYQAFTGASFVTRLAEHLDTEEEEAGAWHWMSRALSGSAGGGGAEVIDLDPGSRASPVIEDWNGQTGDRRRGMDMGGDAAGTPITEGQDRHGRGAGAATDL